VACFITPFGLLLSEYFLMNIINWSNNSVSEIATQRDQTTGPTSGAHHVAQMVMRNRLLQRHGSERRTAVRRQQRHAADAADRAVHLGRLQQLPA
jgi:hypothetical protein